MYEKMKRQVDDELKKHFRPEFLNRIDDTIVFHPLTREEVKEIVDLMLTRVKAQLRVKDLDLELTDNLKTWLAEKGYDPQLGARPLRRTIQRELEDKLSERILLGEFTAGQLIVADVDPDDRHGGVPGRRLALGAGRAAGRARGRRPRRRHRDRRLSAPRRGRRGGPTGPPLRASWRHLGRGGRAQTRPGGPGAPPTLRRDGATSSASYLASVDRRSMGTAAPLPVPLPRPVVPRTLA